MGRGGAELQESLASKTTLATGYSEAAAQYDDVAGALYLTGLRRLLPLVRTVAHPAVLDVGCGTGINLLEVARWFGGCRLLVGIDLSPGMVAVARQKAAAAGVPAIIHVGDAEELPYPDAAFDLVVANSVYHWFHDRPRAMRGFARVLRPGGVLLLTCAAEPGFREWKGLMDTVLQAVVGKAAQQVLPPLPQPLALAADTLGAGLAIEHFHHVVQPLRVYSPEGFFRLMATVSPHWTAHLPPEQRARAAEMAIRNMQTWPGGFGCTWAAIELLARRVSLPIQT